MEDLGIDLEDVELLVVESTPEVRTRIACRLCSCYPRPVLGLPPDCFTSRAYRSRALREPRAPLHEFGTFLADGIASAPSRQPRGHSYLVLPMRPAGTDEMGEAELAELATRDGMIRVSLPQHPQLASRIPASAYPLGDRSRRASW